MARKKRIAIVNTDGDSAGAICLAAGIGEGKPQVQEFADPEATAEHLAETGASIVFFGIDQYSDTALAAIKKYTENVARSVAGPGAVIGIADRASSDLLLEAVRAGVDEFLTPPLDKKSIREAVRNACRKKGILQSDNSSSNGSIFTVFSGKGGCGKTTLVTNLAYHLAQINDASVVIVDLNLQFGNAAAFLDLQPRHTIMECLHGDGVVEDEVLVRMPCKYSSGLSIISGPDDPADSELVRAEHIQALLAALRQKYDFIIADTASSFDERNLAALDISDKIVLLSDTLVPSVRATQRCLKVFERLGYENDKVILVANRFDRRVGAGLKQLEQALGRPLNALVPNASDPVMNSVDAGLPIAEVSEKSDVVAAIEELAFKLAGSESEFKRSRGLFRKITELVGK